MCKCYVIGEMKQAIQNAKSVLVGYYGIHLPDSVIFEILSDDKRLLQEAECGGIFDTCQREILINLVIKKIGINSWPINADSDEYKEKFFRDISVSIVKVGGQFVEDV